MTTMEKTGMLITLLLAVTLIYFLGPILTPFFAAFILAYLGNPAVDRLQRWKMPRSLAVMAVFLLMLLLLVLILLLVVPMVIREIAALLAQAPQVKTWFDTQAAPWIAAHLHIDLQRLAPADLAAFVSSNFTSAGKLASGTLLTLSRSGGMVFAFFL
ncbi:MAG: AI-2E family transporter, partial [Gammaproteobacteria bacterium]|nr:AI-2E family transporter [Gammaproteobacteria bacterium]